MTDDAVLELPGDNSLELRFFRGKFSLSVTNDWAGDTETGFGAHCSRDLSQEEASRLAKFILARAGDAEASRLSTLEAAILTIIKSMNEYLPPTGGDKDKFISEVIGAVDNAMVAKALEVGNADRK